jgi:transcription antitermination factor NusG
MTRRLQSEPQGSSSKNEQASPFPWFALQVRTRNEAGVAEQLRGRGYERFLPLYKVRKRWSDRIKEIDAPLFPGYLFCRFDPQDRLPILKTPGVMQIVGFKKGPVAVDESEIHALQTIISAGAPHQPCPFLTAGDRVRIESGPLLGLEGILTEVRRSHRLVLSVTLLQRSVAVEIDAALVTAITLPKSRQSEQANSVEPHVPVSA